MKKRIIALIMITTMILALTGCGGEEKTTDNSSKNITNGTNKDTDKKEKDEENETSDSNSLTVWCWDPAFNMYAMEEAAKIYKEDHPDFTLNVIETPWEDIQTKLTTAAVSGDLSTLPDIFLMQDNAFQKNSISYPDVFVDLTNSGIDFSQFSGAKVAYSVVDGKNYGVPFDNGTAIGCYRTDILEEAGYSLDDFTDITWSKYIELGKDILDKTGKPLLSCTAGESDVIMMMLQSAGASLFDDEGNPDIVDNEILRKVMETYTELTSSGVMIEVNDWDQYVGSITNSTVAGTINGCWIMASIQTADDQSGNWGITNIPSMDGVQGATNYSNNGGSSWAITTNSKNVELAEEFMGATFAGSVKFYENILPNSGALATYLPAADSEIYGEAQEFFGGEAVYAMITEFSGMTPSNNTGVYYYEARDAVATAITNIVNGADIDSELQSAHDTVNFAMGR